MGSGHVATAAPNRCWASDITYIRTSRGWRYLAILIDLCSRRLVGWTMGSTMKAPLGLEALNWALGHRQIAPDQLLIHTDQGRHAVVESCFFTLKQELDLDDDAETLNSFQQLIRQLAFWIDGYYNRERRHPTIGYLSPIDYA